MNHKEEKDEYLEKLWYMKEETRDLTDDLKKAVGETFQIGIINELVTEGFVELAEAGDRVHLTQKGEDASRRLIRSHRLAERLIHDALGDEFEPGACEFEHIVAPELVDSICTILGHPRECPHGMPIPEGDCCKRSSKSAQSSVVPVTELKVGQAARVAYVNCKDDSRLHKMDGLHIRPGATIKLHQIYPTFVVECEGANIALDKEIAFNICVWKTPKYSSPDSRESHPAAKKRGRGKGFRFRGGSR
jgi:DtxR family Mn-dependent transcriptional regulator